MPKESFRGFTLISLLRLGRRSCMGFTLIELMVAISIVAILATMGMVMFSSSQGAARDAKRKADLEDIKKALYTLKTAKGKIVGANTDFLFWGGWGCSADDSVTCAPYSMNKTGASSYGSMGGNLVYQGYLRAALHDPKCPSTGACSSWSDYYLYILSDDAFSIYARLETAPPSGSLIGCNPSTAGANYNYCISQ